MGGIVLAVAVLCVAVVMGIAENRRRIEALARALCEDAPESQALPPQSEPKAKDAVERLRVVVMAPDFRRRLGGRAVAMLGQDQGAIDVEPEDADYDEIF